MSNCKYTSFWKENRFNETEHIPDASFLNGIDGGFHYVYMILDQMKLFVQEAQKDHRENTVDKVFYCLGFIQGLLWSRGVYTLNEIEGHNR